MKTTRWALVLALVLGLFVAACGDDEEEPASGGGSEQAADVEKFPEDTTMGKIQAAGPSRVALSTERLLLR